MMLRGCGLRRALVSILILFAFVYSLKLPAGGVGGEFTGLDGCDIVVGNQPSGIRWDSKVLTGGIISTESDVRRVAKLALENANLRAEIEVFLASFGGLVALRTNPILWNHYLSLYDGITPFCTEYQELIQYVDSQLPKTGKIADLGTGTGPFAAWLLLRGRDRILSAVDMSDEGLNRTREKLERVAAHLTLMGSSYDLRNLNLREIEGNELSDLSGVVMNNVLYNIPADEQLPFLKKLRGMMRKGGTAVISDPNGLVVTAERLAAAATNVGVSGVRNGARPTDFDVALGIYINVEILRGGIPPFRPPEELKQLAIAAGFKVKHLMINSLYFGLQTVLVLEA